MDLLDRPDNFFLLRHLHHIEFYDFVPHDCNRSADGKKLREIYQHEVGRKASFYVSGHDEGPCTVLEMMIGVAIRMENELAVGPYALKMPECFWTLIENLELHWCDDRKFNNDTSVATVIDDRIHAMMDRKYRANGKGGLFPLRRPSENQKKIEIWYQMQAFLLENYDFD